MAKEKEIIPEAPTDRMKEKVTVTLPRATGKEEDTVFVSLNGKGYNIKRGVPVQVPRPIADILRERERQVDRPLADKDRLRAEAGKNARFAFQPV